MRSVTYLSSATRLLTEDELVTMLRRIRERNTRLGLTGLLLYRGGNIIQVLEGPDEVLAQVYDAIKRDPRHTGLIELLDEQIEERRFGDWAMGFRNVDHLDLEAADGYSRFLDGEAGGPDLHDPTAPAYRLLAMFRENIRW